MKFIKIVIIIIITAILFSSISAYATYNYLAKDISYTPSNSEFEVDNVEDALNELYKSKISSNINFENAELLYSKNVGLGISGDYTFDGNHTKVILFLWGASRDNNVILSYEITDGDIIYDNTLSTYYDTYTKGRIVIIDNISNRTYLKFTLQCQPGIFIYGI